MKLQLKPQQDSAELYELILKCPWNSKGPRKANTRLTEKRALAPPPVGTYYEARALPAERLGQWDSGIEMI